MERRNFIGSIGLLALLPTTLFSKKKDYSYGTKKYPIRAVLNRGVFRIDGVGILSGGKVIHETPTRNFLIREGDTLEIIWKIENHGKSGK